MAVAINHKAIMTLDKKKQKLTDKDRRAALVRKYVSSDWDKPSWCWHKPDWAPFRFLDLPPNVRRQVYVEVAWSNSKCLHKRRHPYSMFRPIDVLASVNHQVHDEIQSIIYMQGFRFLDLPYDIREQIYLFLWAVDPESVTIRLRLKQLQRPKEENAGKAAQRVRRAADRLVCVNHQIRNEILCIYSKHRLFSIQIDATPILCRSPCRHMRPQCVLVAVFKCWRPYTVVRRCELTVDLPLPLGEFRVV